MLPDRLRTRINVEFFSDAGDAVLDAAAAYRVENVVAVKPRAPYRRALALQMEADVLLLLQSSDQRDEGNLPAKLFEYLYARRSTLETLIQSLEQYDRYQAKDPEGGKRKTA